jgi:hypothetical protein
MLDIEEKNIAQNKQPATGAPAGVASQSASAAQTPSQPSLQGQGFSKEVDKAPSAPLPPSLATASTRVKVPGAGNITIVLSLVALVISAVFYLVLVGLAKGVSNNIEQLKRQIGDLERKINSEENQTLVEKYKTLNSQLKTYKTLLNSRVYPARLIKIVLLRYPKRSLFESIDFKEDGSLSFSGRALSLTDVAKAYVALRDYVLLELRWRGGGNSPDINEALNAFSVSKGDVIGFLLPENRAVVIFTQPEPEKFQPLKDPYVMANLKNWEVLRVAPVFSDLQLTSISSEKKSESEANFLASIMKSYTFSVKADPLLFAPPVQSDSLSGEVGHAY